jgi:shikimate kinase / 3-dehydroquinate synthase
MHIFLYGPVGAGKSTVGKILAQDLHLPFVDVDQVIESKVGRTIYQIMMEAGEPGYRDLESATLQEIVSRPESVIALGGGALLRQENRTLVERQGDIIFLAAELDTLLERLGSDSNKRPLLAGDLHETLSSLLARRREHYDSFPLRFDANQILEELSVQIQTALGRFHLSAMGEYDVIVDHAGRILAPHAGADNPSYKIQNPLIVTDENVAGYHLENVKTILRSSGLEAKAIVVPAGEDHKNLHTISHLWDAFLENGLDRRSTVIALGGGVISDMTGFAAATYMRGIQWICVPTTLLSMVDASIGGKTGFDLPQGKNLIGSFYPPKMVLADTRFLATLPQRELISGMAEVIKHGVISDPGLFALCACGWDWVRNNLEQVVRRAMAVKIKVIEEDPYERGIRAALNLGHTVGHAVELASQFQLRHGEAVAIGMAVEARYAERIGIAQPGLSDTISGVLFGYGLPVKIPGDLPHAAILRAMRVDKKKNATSIRFALPVEIGRVQFVEVTDLEAVLEE